MNLIVYVGDVIATTHPGAAQRASHLVAALAARGDVSASVLGQPAAIEPYRTVAGCGLLVETDADAVRVGLATADLLIQVHPFQRRPAEIPTVVVVPDLIVHDAPWAFLPSERAPLVRALHKNVMRSTAVVTPHPYVAERLVDVEPLADGKTVLTACPPLVAPSADERISTHVGRRFGIGTETPTLVYAAARRPHKNHWALLDAVAEVQRGGTALRLLCVGPPGVAAWEAVLERRVDYLGLDAVDFAGYLEAAELSALLHLATGMITVAPAEGSGATCADAVAHRTAVACPATPSSLADLARLDLSVPTFDAFDPSDLASALATLVADHAHIVAGYTSAVGATDDWTWDRVAADILAAVEQVPG